MPRRHWCSPIRPWRWWPCCRPWAGAARRWSAVRTIERLAGDFLLPDAARLAQSGSRDRHHAPHPGRRLSRRLRPDTALILHSQPAEFAMTGSVAQAGLDELVALAAGRQIPLVASLPAPACCRSASPAPAVCRSWANRSWPAPTWCCSAATPAWAGREWRSWPAAAADRADCRRSLGPDLCRRLALAHGAGRHAAAVHIATDGRAFDSARAAAGRFERQPETSGRAARSADPAFLAGHAGGSAARRRLAERSPTPRRAAAELVPADRSPGHECRAAGGRPGRAHAGVWAQADDNYLTLNCAACYRGRTSRS